MVVAVLSILLIAGCGQQEATTTSTAKETPSAEAEAVEGPSLIAKEDLEQGIDVGELI